MHGLSVHLIPLVLDPCSQVPSPPLSPKLCWNLAVPGAGCARAGSAACRGSRVTQPLPLVGSWRGAGGKATLAWFPL